VKTSAGPTRARRRGPAPNVAGVGRAHSPALSPVALAALAVLVLNDHLAKPWLHDEVTGKVSDVAGLILLPLLAAGAIEMAHDGACRLRDRPRPAPLGAGPMLVLTGLSGAAFAAAKTWGPATRAYELGMGGLQWVPALVVAAATGRSLPPVRPVTLVADPTDLLALLALAVPGGVAWRRLPSRSRGGAR
jgi:hypothetical protein